MASMTDPQIDETLASVLHIWHSAVDAIQTDGDISRRQAYERAIASVCSHFPEFTRIQELIAYYWSGQLQADAALASISRQGHVLNYQVVAAAACWHAMDQAMLAR